MSPTLEHIRQEMRSLRPSERFDLWRDLGAEFEPAFAAEDDMESVEAAWNAELSHRVKEIEEGKVTLVSADEAIQRVRKTLAAQRADRTRAP